MRPQLSPPEIIKAMPENAPAEPSTWHSNLENRLQQFQKTEALGRASMEVLHEINNMLSIITSASELLALEVRDGSALGHVNSIQHATERAAMLTEQFLHLGVPKSEPSQSKIIDLNPTIQNMLPMLECLLSRNVHIQFRLSEHPVQAALDPSDLEHILVNFIINARDAMEKEGTIRIETDVMELHTDFRHDHGTIPEGTYSRLKVRDTGTGMSEQTRIRLFDPFYTTKDPGHGSGLGMTIIHGILLNTSGYVTVWTEEGEGTQFEVYWPLP